MELEVRDSQAKVPDRFGKPKAADAKPTIPRSLIILGCSQRKQQATQLLPALDRYDGIFFRVLKKWMRESPPQKVEILIISARFGLISADTLIPDYDQRMTKLRAVELAMATSTALLAHLAQRSYDRIFVNLGKDYEGTIAEIELLKQSRWASGSIGKRARQMKQWLAEAG